MSMLKKVTALSLVSLALYIFYKIVWLLFWDILWKILAVLKAAFMIALVMMAIYVLWSILSYKSDNHRD